MRNVRAARLFILLALAAILAPATRAHAQVTTATLFGIVRDSSGAVVPGANMTATHEETGRVRTSITEAGGEFTLAAVPSGAYTLTIELTGFKTSTRRGLQLSPGQTARQTFQIEIGAIEESVTVQALVPLIETASSCRRR
jgi:hypothetical protein